MTTWPREFSNPVPPTIFPTKPIVVFGGGLFAWNHSFTRVCRRVQTASSSLSVERPEFLQVAAPAQPLKQIGRYRIEKVLGKGGFGLVYLAHDEQLDRLVAIKVPHAKLISKPEDAEAYLAEARTVANLDHPGIVPVHDVGSTEEAGQRAVFVSP